MTANIPLLPPSPIIEASGTPTMQMQQWWQQAVAAIVQNIDDIAAALAQAVAAQNAAIAAQAAAIDALNAAVEAQSTADDASASASTAQATATGAATAAATAQTAADAAQATANSKLSQSTADGRYVLQDQTAAWTDPTGTVTRAGFATYASPGAAASYDQSQIDAAMTALQDSSQSLAALILDLRANNTLT